MKEGTYITLAQISPQGWGIHSPVLPPSNLQWKDPHQFYIPYVPRPQKRPRLSKAGVYNPSAADRNVLHWQLKAQRHFDAPLEGPLFFGILLVYKRPQRNKLLAPDVKNGDVDNLAKILLDAAIGALMIDDKQVVQLVTSKIYAP